jgi:hypothetical protein
LVGMEWTCGYIWSKWMEWSCCTGCSIVCIVTDWVGNGGDVLGN